MKWKLFDTGDRFLAFFRESLAILAAILVAFTLDAWWEERREYEQMLDALDAVSLEIERNIGLLDEAIEYNRAQGRRGFQIAQLQPGDVDELPLEQLIELAQIPEYNLVRLQLGAVTAFIEGGYLAILSERELRAEIAAIPRMQEEIDEEMEVVQEAQRQLEMTMTGDLSVDGMLQMFQDPSARGLLIRSIASSEEARRALLFRSFILGELYTSELQEARRLLTNTQGELQRYSD